MNPWVVTIGGGLILTWVIDFIRSEKIFSTFVVIISWVWKKIVVFLNLEIKMWWLLIATMIIVVGLYVVMRILDAKQQESNEADFLKYTTDSILDFKWRWQWSKDTLDNKYDVSDLHPICPKCGTPLVESHGGYSEKYECLRCKYTSNKRLPDFNHVKMMIRDNVERKYFNKDV